MGKKNRQRAAASAHRVHADASPRSAGSTGSTGSTDGQRYDPRAEIERLVREGVLAVTGRAGGSGSDRAGGDGSVADTIRRLEAIDRDDLIDDVVVRVVGPMVSGAWELGWSALDLVHAVHHEFDRGIAGLVADMVLADPTLQRPDRPDSWTEQLELVRIRRGRRSTSPDDFGKLADRFLVARF
ncbi:MAG: hypothetical protein NTZ21_06625, partial [Actinobacteria bacterium]|nr:hypothetical protein [Actinomycetota bacterium]